MISIKWRLSHPLHQVLVLAGIEKVHCQTIPYWILWGVLIVKDAFLGLHSLICPILFIVSQQLAQYTVDNDTPLLLLLTRGEVRLLWVIRDEWRK